MNNFIDSVFMIDSTIVDVIEHALVNSGVIHAIGIIGNIGLAITFCLS